MPFRLRGDNHRAWESTDRAYLLSGGSGTGKTVTNLMKCYQFGQLYPGTRILLTRKTRASLTDTALVTWERDILGPRHKMLTRRPNLRKVRQTYNFSNGSEMLVAGMDNPEKVLSGDFDLICMIEATDFPYDDYQVLKTRLRTGIAPYQQIIGDCNPTFPAHWLFQEISATNEDGSQKMRSFNSRHKDNPAYWDRETNDWTPLGRSYVEVTLRNMTGARRKRFYEGKWASAEGLVFDAFDPAIHGLPSGWRPPDFWRRFWVIDWGFTAPLCLQMWAIDPDGRIILFREIYKTGMRVETLARECKQLVETHEELRPMAVVTDHDPEAQATWREYSGLPCENAWKEDKYENIQAALGRFDLAGDGKPRIYIVDGARYHRRDETLVAMGKPTSTIEEMAGWTWNTKDIDKKEAKEMPVKLNDHGCDALIYSTAYADSLTGGNLASTGDARDRVVGDVRNESW
jgi:PBSX family phage terminase large subunit